ncbi:ATP-binding protein [Variovorax ureilyticus]|uniref:histidine kinase n=1 Tax=Variovorax ureilyticus TaxID=1836198 RepID=A0ABU8VAH7_9BURK
MAIRSSNPAPNALRWLLVCAAVIALVLGMKAAIAPPAEPEGTIRTFGSADALLEPDGMAPIEGPVDLARRWDRDFPGQGGRASYRIMLPPRDGDVPMALLFSRVGSQVEVLVNGGVVQHWGTLGDPLFDAAKHPVMAVVPAALLHPDRANELRVNVTIQPQRLGGLSVLRYGPKDAIEAMYDTNRRWREIAMLVFAVGLLGMGVFTGVLWVRQRLPMYGWFSLGALLGMLRIIDRAWADVPVPWPWLGALAAICYMTHMALMCRFSVLATGAAPRAVDRSVDVAIVASSVLTVLSFALRKPLLLTLGICTIVPMALACLWTVARRAWAGGGAGAWLLAAALVASIAAGLHDLVLVRLSNASGLRSTYLQHAMFAFVPIMGWLIAERYSRTAANFHELNADLSRRVDEREQQLRAAFDALREQQHHQAISNERQRIMREIHDGVGSQLVALLNMVARPDAQPQALREHVQLALDEMRMSVDSLQPANDDLATVLATLRYRLQSRLEAAGIGVVWDVAELPELRELSPNMVMHVQRIVLEAFTNVLKHARATRIIVRARLADDGSAATLQIADNGVGLRGNPAAAGAGRRRGGRGLDNMRSRARAIGAKFHIDQPAEGGTCISLALKVEPGESAFSALSRPVELG